MYGVGIEAIVYPTVSWTGTLIFLNDYGIQALQQKAIIDDIYGREFCLPNIKIIYTTSPYQRCKDDKLTYTWFNKSSMSPEANEDLKGIDESAKLIKDIIAAESYDGIKMTDIILGGFAMGGYMSLHLAYRHLPNIAGVFAASTCLNNESAVYKAVQEASSSLPSLLMTHGKKNCTVPYDSGRSTYDLLSRYVSYASFQNSSSSDQHIITKEELNQIREFAISRFQ